MEPKLKFQSRSNPSTRPQVQTTASNSSTTPSQFNGRYSSEMHRELPKSRRSAFVIKTKSSSSLPKEIELYSTKYEDENAKELVKLIRKFENGRKNACSPPMGTPEPSIEEIIPQRELRRVSVQIPSSIEDNRRKALKRCQQLVLYLRHASSCRNEYCTVFKHCDEMKALWAHLHTCETIHGSRLSKCTYKYCEDAHKTLIHYDQCGDNLCSLCSPVRTSLWVNKWSKNTVFCIEWRGAVDPDRAMSLLSTRRQQDCRPRLSFYPCNRPCSLR